MRMKKFRFTSLRSLLAIVFFSLMLGACHNDDAVQLTPKEQAGKAAKESSAMVAITQDVMAITDGLMPSNGFAGGKTAHDGDDDDDDGDDNDDGDDDSDKCKPSISGSFKVNRSFRDSLIFTGIFTLDFGDGSACDDSLRRRKGKIIDSITVNVGLKGSRRFASTEKITFQGFHKDTVQVDGTFIVKSSTGNPTTVEAQNAKITYSDGTSFSWDGTLTFVYDKKGSRHCKGTVKKITDGTITGTTRSGAAFTATITKEIVFKRGCFGKQAFIPVSGTVEVTTSGITSTFDYGDGSCDKVYTITTAGIATDHTF
jgi:hypothetical protein